MVEAAGATSNSNNNDNSRRGSTISCPGMQTAKTQAADRRLKNQSDESAFMTDSFIFRLVLDLPSCLIWPASSIRNIHGNSGGKMFRNWNWWMFKYKYTGHAGSGWNTLGLESTQFLIYSNPHGYLFCTLLQYTEVLTQLTENQRRWFLGSEWVRRFGYTLEKWH